MRGVVVLIAIEVIPQFVVHPLSAVMAVVLVRYRGCGTS